MPFEELKPKEDFIRIKKSGDVIFCVTLIRKYHLTGKKIKVFHDSTEKKIGFKPDDDGYKISSKNTITCRSLCKMLTGEFYPKWSEKHKMLIISY